MQAITPQAKSQAAAPRALKANPAQGAPAAPAAARPAGDRMAFTSLAEKSPSKILKQSEAPTAGSWVGTAFGASNVAAMGGFALAVMGMAGGSPVFGAVGAFACMGGLVGFAGFGIALMVMKATGK